jgi:hypothetical protein
MHTNVHVAPSLILLQDHDSVLVEGTCQIPDPLYKLIGSIVCFYIPLGVMLLTYALTVRLLAFQQQNLGGGGAGWSSGWLGPGTPSLGKKHVLLPIRPLITSTYRHPEREDCSQQAGKCGDGNKLQ